MTSHQQRPLRVEPSSLKDYFLRHWVIIIYSFLVAFFCYGYELFNFTLSIDEEVQSFIKAIDFKKNLADGRWGSYLFQVIFSPYSLMP